MSFPYADRPMWLYSRSSDKHLKVLFQQMQNLLDEANRREYTLSLIHILILGFGPKSDLADFVFPVIYMNA